MAWERTSRQDMKGSSKEKRDELDGRRMALGVVQGDNDKLFSV